jgi:hypothetical protein
MTPSYAPLWWLGVACVCWVAAFWVALWRVLEAAL